MAKAFITFFSWGIQSAVNHRVKSTAVAIFRGLCEKQYEAESDGYIWSNLIQVHTGNLHLVNQLLCKHFFALRVVKESNDYRQSAKHSVAVS